MGRHGVCERLPSGSRRLPSIPRGKHFHFGTVIGRHARRRDRRQFYSKALTHDDSRVLARLVCSSYARVTADNLSRSNPRHISRRMVCSCRMSVLCLDNDWVLATTVSQDQFRPIP